MSMGKMRELAGKTIKRASFHLDGAGYQHLVIEMGDGTLLDCYENQQAGETALQINGSRVAPDEANNER